jgi:hypothetical protein
VLSHIFQTITSLIEDYQKPTGFCQRPKDYRSYEISYDHGSACDAMVLGTLLRGYVKCGIWPIPMAPYTGLTVQRVLKEVLTLKVQTLCEITNGIYEYRSYAEGDHKDGVKDSTVKLVSFVEYMMDGLHLGSFNYLALKCLP